MKILIEINDQRQGEAFLASVKMDGYILFGNVHEPDLVYVDSSNIEEMGQYGAASENRKADSRSST